MSFVSCVGFLRSFETKSYRVEREEKSETPLYLMSITKFLAMTKRSTAYLLLALATAASAFTPLNHATKTISRKSSLFAAPVGPLARAKKLLDPEEYNRVIQEKMKRSKGLSRAEAEEDYNNFLESPPFYYALEKKVSLFWYT